jgi:hypothetical protein
MPEAVDRHGAWPYVTPLDSSPQDGFRGRGTVLRLRLRAAVHRTKLTRALAEGVDPDAGDELALRARQLTSERARKAFAHTLRRTIAEAHLPASTRARVSIIDGGAVRDAEDAIAGLIERLLSPLPVRAQGVALLERILTNADGVRSTSGASPARFGRRSVMPPLHWICGSQGYTSSRSLYKA